MILKCMIKLKSLLLLLVENSILPSVKVITGEVLTNIVDAAQKQYNEWNQNADGVDEELGTGGICHLIADELASIISDNGVECSTVSSSHEQHVYLVCQFREGVYEIDIPYGVYETGGGYNWKKLPNVIFDKSHVVVNKLDNDPNEFNNYTNEL